MTMKTIPAYLEDERQKNKNDQLRIDAEAARMLPLQHGRHHTAKLCALEFPSAVEATPKARKTVTATRKKRAARKTVTRARKIA